MKKILFAVAATAVLAGSAAESALASHAWGSYHWARTANPFTAAIIDNVDTSWDGYLQTSSSEWSSSNVLDAPTLPGVNGDRKCKPTAGRVTACNAAYGKNGWLGLAQIWLNGSHITQGTAKMNDSYFSMARYNTPSERRHVMCQEIGHTFGLGHTSEDGSTQDTCMDYSSSLTSQAPNAHDYELLESIYQHLDGGSTLAAAPASTGMAGREGSRPYRVDRHDHPRSSTITERFADGTSLVTVVELAE